LVLPEGCTLESVDGPCVASVLETLLPRAFRRPATSAEVDRYRALFEGRVAESDPPDEALRVVLEAVLMSPHFLYRSELSTGDQDVESELDGYAVASRLSYLLWSTMPDAALFEAAEDGSLLDRDGIEAEVQRMLDSPRGHVGTHRFVAEWLAFDEAEVITKDASLLEGLPETLQEDVERETELFVADALLGPEHSLDTLLTASHTFANATVAELYGLEGIEGAEFQRVELDTATRRGILTQPLAIAGNSKEAGFSPVQMGRFVREHLLCQTIPPPPPTASTSVDDSPLGPDATFRERLTALTSDPACAGCHVLLNEPGFSFLPYDPIGRYLTADASGRPFDTAGTLTGVDGDDTAFANAGEMLDAIAASDALHGCFTRHYLEFAFGRTLAPSDFVLYHALVDALEASDGDFVDLVTSLTTSPEFGRTGPRQ